MTRPQQHCPSIHCRALDMNLIRWNILVVVRTKKWRVSSGGCMVFGSIVGSDYCIFHIS